MGERFREQRANGARRWRAVRLVAVLLACATAFCLSAVASAQGIIMPANGAGNLSMAGTSTALATDAAGATYWNPAVISALPNQQVYFGAELIYPDIHLLSSTPQNSGRTYSDSGLAAAPTIAAVFRPRGSPLSFGFGMNGVAGGGVNFPKDPNNPVTNLLGPIYGSLSVLQVAPMVAWNVTDRLSIGIGPTVNTMLFSVDPAFFAPNGGATFASATHGRPFWGGGYQLGVLYQVTPDWSLGFSYKSEQWFETLVWNTVDGSGNPREARLNVTLPQIFSWGTAWHVTQPLTAAIDLRYFNYRDTLLFGQRIVDGGLGWRSIFAAAAGLQYQMNRSAALRAGYLYNENPVPNVGTLFNVQAPAITQHQLAIGANFRLGRSVIADLAAIYGFPAAIQGTEREVPNTFVRINAQYVALAIGIGVNF